MRYSRLDKQSTLATTTTITMKVIISASWIESFSSRKRRRQRSAVCCKDGSEGTILEEDEEERILSPVNENPVTDPVKAVHFSPTAQLHVYPEVDTLRLEDFWYAPEEIRAFKRRFQVSRDEVCLDSQNNAQILAMVRYYKEECCCCQQRNTATTSLEDDKRDDRSKEEEGADDEVKVATFSQQEQQDESRWSALPHQLLEEEFTTRGLESCIIRSMCKYDGQRRLLRQYDIVCPRLRGEGHRRRRRPGEEISSCSSSTNTHITASEKRDPCLHHDEDAPCFEDHTEQIAAQCQIISLASRRFAHAVAIGRWYRS